jgi:hypothetical protein
VSNVKLIDPKREAKKLLVMPTREAEALFQSYTPEQQLAIISSTRNPREREELYYLVPDCTELIQRSPTEEVLQILDTMLGTGTASVLLPCLSPEQFEEMMDVVLWRNGKLDEKSLNLWLYELSECERDELGRLLSQIDVGVIANLLHGRVEMKTDYKALLMEAGMVDPSGAAAGEGGVDHPIEYADERARAIVEAIWEADPELFTRLLYELFALDEESDATEGVEERELEVALERAKEKRDVRVWERDRAAGIDMTEDEIFERVDLDDLDLEDEESDEYGTDDEDSTDDEEEWEDV